MTWGKVSDRLHAHSKVRRAREAMALWVLAMSWSCDELTDGAIPADMPDLILPGLGDAMAEKLVAVGLWERTETGYRFHDWAQYQPSGVEEKARRADVSRVRSEAGKLGNAKRWGSQTDRKTIANGSQTDRNCDPKAIANGSQDDRNGIATASQNDRPDPDPVPEKKTATPSSRERASAHEGARETATPDAFDTLAAITAGAAKGAHPSAWDHRGDSRTVTAFVGALRAQGRTEPELRALGAYLASDDCAAKFKAKSFAPRSFVFRSDDGLDASRVEHLCLAAREWVASRSKIPEPIIARPELPSPFLTPPRPIKRPFPVPAPSPSPATEPTDTTTREVGT